MIVSCYRSWASKGIELHGRFKQYSTLPCFPKVGDHKCTVLFGCLTACLSSKNWLIAILKYSNKLVQTSRIEECILISEDFKPIHDLLQASRVLMGPICYRYPVADSYNNSVAYIGLWGVKWNARCEVMRGLLVVAAVSVHDIYPRLGGRGFWAKSSHR